MLFTRTKAEIFCECDKAMEAHRVTMETESMNRADAHPQPDIVHTGETGYTVNEREAKAYTTEKHYSTRRANNL